MENSLQVTRATIDYQSGTISLHLTNSEPFTVSYENLDHDQLDPIIGFLDHLHLIANHHNPYPPNYLPLRLPASGTVKELRVGDPSYLVLEEANHLYRIKTTNLQGTDTSSKIIRKLIAIQVNHRTDQDSHPCNINLIGKTVHIGTDTNITVDNDTGYIHLTNQPNN